MKLLNKLGCILFLTLAHVAIARAGDFLIHDGDRVVFLGDSITEQRLYTTYIEAYALTRHPEWSLTFRNVGWGGDTSWLRQRSHPDERQLFAADATAQQKMVDDAVGRGLARDVLPLKPTFVTVNFGMNDHAYQAFREDIFRAYIRSQTEIAKVLEAHGARVAFLTPQPIEDNKRADPDKDVRNESLRKFSDGLKIVAEQNNAAFVDQFDPYMAVLLRERAANPPTFVGGGNAVHPGPIGHTVMAWAILKGLGATPVVSSAEIDAAGKKVVAAEGCKVSHVKWANRALSFDRLDEALPMPIDERAEPALKLAPVLQDLDQLELKVTGMPAGTYEVKIDGEPAGKISSEELARGWNFADAGGPITAQARKLLKAVFAKNDIFFQRWRAVQLYEFPKWAQGPETEKTREVELARLDGEIKELEGTINELRKPKRHHFEVQPAVN